MTCKEFVRDDVSAITAIPLSDVFPGIVSWQITPTIPGDEFDPSLDNAITIGLFPVTEGGALIPMMRMKGKVKDEESDSVAGRLHTVTVTCEADDRDPDVWPDLLALERAPFHLLVTFRDNTQAFVAATEDTYKCTTDRDGAKTSVAFRIENFMGLQFLV